MANERRHKLVLGVIAAFFVLFAAQLVNLQVFGNTKPVSLAPAKASPVVRSHEEPKRSTPGLNVRFQKWWQRTVQARVVSVPAKAKRLADRVWKKLGAA